MSSTNNNNGKKPRWSHADKAGAKRGQDPVSYTHLTLPTICSV